MKRTAEEIIVSNKLDALVVILSNISDELCEIKSELKKTQLQVSQIAPQNLTPSSINKEDYE